MAGQDIHNGVSGGGAAAATGWSQKYAVDFSTLPTQNLKTGGDGTKVIDGKNWEAVNTGNATAWDLDGSTGLVWDTNNGNYDYGSRTSPYLYALITSLWSDYNAANHLLRMWFHFSFTPANAWDSFLMALERLGGVGGEHIIGAMFSHDGGSNDRWGIYHGSSGSNGFTASTDHLADDVLCVEQTPNGVIIRTGTYSGGWPDIENMNAIGMLASDKGNLCVPHEQTNAAIVLSNFKDSGAPADATLVAFRLDAK